MKLKITGLAFRLSMYILLGVVVIFGGIMLYNYSVSRKLVIRAAEESARIQTVSAVREIEKILQKVEKVPKSLSRVLEHEDLSPSQIQEIFSDILEDTPEIFGLCIGYEPYTYFPDSVYFAPYVWRKDGSIFYEDIGGAHYDYFFIDWYQIPKMLNEAVWAEPYFDEFGGDEIMSTYSVPFYRNIGGERVFQGIVTADISLSWLRSIVDSLEIFEGGFGFLLSRNGTIVTHPNPDFIMNQSIFSLAEEVEQPYLREIGRSMQRLEGGFRRVQPISLDRVSWMFYEPLKANRWSLAVIFPEDELFAELVSLNRQLLILGILGLVLLIIIISLLSRRITGPLEKLVIVAEQIGSGNMDLNVPSFKTMDEVALLASAFGRMKSSLHQHMEQLKSTTAAKEKIESELRIAHDIQMGIIPRIFPPFPDKDQIDIYGILDPAREVGGDLYDFFFVDENRLCVAIGDVSGKGVPASLLMAISRTLLRAKATKDTSVSEILTSINNELCADNDNAMFVTFLLAILDVRTGELVFSNAGHNYPCIVHRKGGVKCIPDTHGIPLGLFESTGYAFTHVKLELDDILVLYTDGITEAMNEEEELYGEERMEAQISAKTWNSPRELTESLVADVKDFCGAADQSDDITILCLHWKGNEKGTPDVFRRELRLKNIMTEISHVAELVETLAKDWHFEEKFKFDLNLVLEELISNIIFYAYEDQLGHEIRLIIEKHGNQLEVLVEDDGRAFDPLAEQRPLDLDKPAEEREIGGLGIHFVRQLTESLSYARKDNKNILRFTKLIKQD